MKALWLGVFILVVAGTALSATAREVSYKSGDQTVQAILYTPKGKGPFPGLVVIHEWWGLNDWVKEQAARLADEGYAALAVDLYRGQIATTPADAQKLLQDLSDDRAFGDLHAAVEFLKAQPEVRPDRIGSVGWCMGGGYSLDVAIQEPTLSVVVINYGDLTDDREELKKINAHVLGIFGGQDRDIHLADVRKFERQLKDLGKTADIRIYPDAGHAFENPNNTAGYRKDDSADAWKRTLAFLASTLKR